MTKNEDLYAIDLKKGEKVILTAVELKKTDLSIEAIPIGLEEKNLFGYSKKTERLPGHQYYKENK